jgi:hypothetical protein
MKVFPIPPLCPRGLNDVFVVAQLSEKSEVKRIDTYTYMYARKDTIKYKITSDQKSQDKRTRKSNVTRKSRKSNINNYTYTVTHIHTHTHKRRPTQTRNDKATRQDKKETTCKSREDKRRQKKDKTDET